jgi:Flp pilus assembly protein TadG
MIAPTNLSSDPAAPRSRAPQRLRGDRGAADIGIEMLFGAVMMITLFLLLIEATSFWHARNVLDDAAAEGARVAAAFDGSCDGGVAVARARLSARAGSWATDVSVSCSETDGIVTVVIASTTPGLLSSSTGYQASVTESAPKEQ